MNAGEPLRILLVSNMYPSEANPRFGIFVQRQAESLRRAGVEVIAEPIAGDRGAWDYVGSRGRLRELIRQHRPQVIHAHYGYSLAATCFQGVPVVVTLYGDDVNGESRGGRGITFKSRIGVLLTQVLARWARSILVQSEAMRARLWPAARARAEVLGNGVDDDFFSPGPKDVARERLGLDPAATVLVFVNSGRQPTKRLDLALLTRDELRRRGRQVELLVAEEVPADDMRWYYRAADVLLMTSDSEGSPNCVKEALASGIPIVSVPVGDVPDLLVLPERGRIASRSPSDLADAVESVVQSPRAARSLLPEPLQSSRVAARLIEIYRQVIVSR